MADVTRRTFLSSTGQVVAGVATLGSLGATKASAADGIVLGAIGCGGQGSNLMRSFATLPGVTIAYVCDPDRERVGKAAELVTSASGTAPKTVGDLRTILDDKSVDGVIVATPDHWHGPATLLACAAGKHVYVEKPCAHNIREGRLMIEAARRHERIVQVGTQSRSARHLQEGIQLLREGAIGDVLVAKAWNSQLRGNIGHAQPSEPPANVDYDMWTGPAPMIPYQSNLLHYGWHWFYNFGTGDMGNDGVHDIDIARWGLGMDRHPDIISAAGGKLFFDDDQQFPDTQYVAFTYLDSGKPSRQLIFEQRIWSPYVQEGYENGNAFYGTKGMMLLGKAFGWKLFGRKNELLKSSDGRIDASHHINFVEGIRQNRRTNADIEIGHYSAALCHLGNIAVRQGKQLRFNPKTEQIVDDAESNALVGRSYRPGHWAAPPV